MSRFFIICTLSLIICGCRTAPKTGDVVRVITSQAEAWNEGDIDEFMQTYLRSDELTFVTSDGVTKGWKATLDRYKARYPDKASMGELTFPLEDVEVLRLGDKSAYVLGKWMLDREPPHDDLYGWFTLIMLNTPEGWRIVHDHSSLATEKKSD